MPAYAHIVYHGSRPRLRVNQGAEGRRATLWYFRAMHPAGLRPSDKMSEAGVARLSIMAALERPLAKETLNVATPPGGTLGRIVP
jgi:hypothetical protein